MSNNPKEDSFVGLNGQVSTFISLNYLNKKIGLGFAKRDATIKELE